MRHHLIPEKHSTIILIILSLFATIGPVSIDIFTPSLPAITRYFSTDTATAQLSVSIFMLGFAISMLICGPLADKFGRKKTLLIGYIIYFLASLVILNTSNIYIFLMARFSQATFGCFGTVLARTIARDYYKDQMEVKMLAYISGCLTLGPMIAPIIGGFLQEYAGWKYNFVVMQVLVVITIIALHFIPEVHIPKKNQQHQDDTSILSSYITILSDSSYLRFTIAAGTAFAGAFVFVVGAPFVFIDQLGITPKYYGMLFASIIAAYIISTACVPYLNSRFSRADCLKIASTFLVIGASVSLITGYFSHGQSGTGYIAGVIIYELGLGIYLPICQARATEHMKTNIGIASSLIFFIEMLLVTAITGIVSGLQIQNINTTSLALISMITTILSILCLFSPIPSTIDESVRRRETSDAP
ncbi:MAG: multidrug effflux MFS transporter [Candidatus Endonucleobacter bathymodioli]|uniref:Bcr/CflA family efflux transporter n=1 Tax=Candidatus Endonucleibacter bathymodioli TaxID=539814 RepID=A0AA90SC87_9GAMM|nr:multidrug effflux MFS transporter [Candidatus Endonucleobacter bathymodioli]